MFVRRLMDDYLKAEAEQERADRYANCRRDPICKTLDFGYVIVKKPISKRTPVRSVRPLKAAKHVKAAKLKETNAPIAVRNMTVGMLPPLQPRHVSAQWHAGMVCKRVFFVWEQSVCAEPLVAAREGNAKLRATLAEKKHIEKIRLATGVHGYKGPTF